ncbi:SH3 domain-containing protein [Neptunomonas phycophila]|jgi:hypothetical protein|nr:SH3 domain-containing protein [Neptunomonas phycophila]
MMLSYFFIGDFMRLIIRLICASLLLAGSCVHALEYYTVIDEPINVRTGPGTQNKAIAQAHKNEQVLLIKKEGDWANIFFVHPDGRKIEGWMHADFIKPDAAVRQENTPVTAHASYAHMECQEDAEKEVIATCLLDIDISIAGPQDAEAVSVLCESEMLYNVKDGEALPVQESGNIRTPLKHGEGAARMQLVIFPSAKQPVSSVTVVDYRCVGHPV